MENTGFYVIPNKTQYEIGERVWLEIKKTGPTKANHVKVSLFTYQGENLKMECTLEQGVYIPLAESISEKTGGYLVKIEFFQKTEKLGRIAGQKLQDMDFLAVFLRKINKKKSIRNFSGKCT